MSDRNRPWGLPLLVPFTGPTLRYGSAANALPVTTRKETGSALPEKSYDLTTNAPVAGAMLDVWQAATNGLYENQDENQPDYNLRGRFRANRDRQFRAGRIAGDALPRAYRRAGRRTDEAR
jgi:catechol 1,2-dioxygenase